MKTDITEESRPKMYLTSFFRGKVEFLCKQFPENEWSGILFYDIEKYKTNKEFCDIICKDLLLMDIGSTTYTDFKMNEEVAGYLAENPELISCQMALIHSHNAMEVFYSGTDLDTINENAKEVNHFVSLVVNNAGEYLGVITRRVVTSWNSKGVSSYQSFNGKTGSFNVTGESKEYRIEKAYFDVVKADSPKIPSKEEEYLLSRIEFLKSKMLMHEEEDNLYSEPHHSYNGNPFSDAQVDEADYWVLQILTLNPLVSSYEVSFLNSIAEHLPIMTERRFGDIYKEQIYHNYLVSFFDSMYEELYNTKIRDNEIRNMLTAIRARLEQLSRYKDVIKYILNVFDECVYITTMEEE